MAVIIPPHVTDWLPGVLQGYVGGPPDRAVTVDVGSLNPEEGPSGNRATNDAIWATAYGMLSSGGHAKWPSGRFNLTAFGSNKSNTTISGSSETDLTEFRVTGTSGVTCGTGVDWTNNYNPNAVVLSGLTQGSNTVYVDQPFIPFTGGPTSLSAGYMVKFFIPNESTTPVYSYTDLTYLRSFVRRVVSYNSGTGALVFFPPLNFSVVDTTGVFVAQSQYATQENIVFENMLINGADSSGGTDNGFQISNSFGAVIRHCKVINFDNYGLKCEDTVNTEIYRSEVGAGYGGGSNRSGLLMDRCANGYVHDNWFHDHVPSCEINKGTEGLIFAFNKASGGGDQVWNINHGGYNSYNLFEGNRGAYYISDCYFAGAGRQTIFRSYDPKGVLAALKRFDRNTQLLGNINGTPGSSPADTQLTKWGLPNIGNEYSNGTSDVDTGSYDPDYDTATGVAKKWAAEILTRTDSDNATIQIDPAKAADFLSTLQRQENATSNLAFGYRIAFGVQCTFSSVNTSTGVIVAVTNAGTQSGNPASGWPVVGTAFDIFAGPGGFQTKDLRTALSVWRKKNYYAFYAGYPSGEDIGADTIPDSLHLSGKPDSWGAMAFPPFDPADPFTTTTGNRIPADQFASDGTWPDDAPPTPTAPAFTVQPATQTVTAGATVTFLSAASGYPSPTYQWKKGGVDISGATSASYTITGVALGDAGSYTCVATNTEGSDTSDAAVLTVNAAVATTPQPRRRSASLFGFNQL